MTARSLELADLISTIEQAEERWLELSELAP
jgi:ATP-binding cassette subfamily F protein uup